MLNFLLETFLLGLRNLRLHKLRSFLTALGIIFGVAAVIIMVAIGEGTKQAAMEQLEQLGATNILLRSVKPGESSDTTRATSRVLEYGLKRVDLERLKTIPNVEVIVPLRDTEQQVVRGEFRANASAIGTVPEAFDVMKLRLARGRYFTQLDYDRQAPVCVIGAAVSRQLFPYEDPLGQVIQVGSPSGAMVLARVVGVLEPSGLRGEGASMINRDLDKDLYFPMSLARAVFSDTITRQLAGSFERKTIELSEIWLQVGDMSEVETTAAVTQNVLEQAHAGKGDYEVKVPISILRSAERVQRQFNFVLGGIASISLLVGGIGIMNIMLAGVTERTKEIGIRRALGAKRRHITLQFLVETTVISISGGVIGILIGCGAAKALPALIRLLADGANYPTSIASWSVIASFVVSAAIGIVFGLYPAIMAARMNPIEALRHE